MLLEKLLWRSKPPHKQIFIVETSLVKRDELHISTILSTLLPMNYHHYRQDVEGVEQDIHLDHEVLFGYRKGHYGYNMASLAVVLLPDRSSNTDVRCPVPAKRSVCVCVCVCCNQPETKK